MLTHEQTIGFIGLLATAAATVLRTRTRGSGRELFLAPPLLAAIYVFLMLSRPEESTFWFPELGDLGNALPYWAVANGCTFILTVLGVYALLVGGLSERRELMVLDSMLFAAAYIVLIFAPWMGETLPLYPSRMDALYILVTSLGLGAGMASARVFLEKPEPSIPALGLVLLIPSLLVETWRYVSTGHVQTSAPSLVALAFLLSLIYSGLGFGAALRRLSFLAIGLMLISTMPLMEAGTAQILTSKQALAPSVLALAHVVFIGWGILVRRVGMPSGGAREWSPVSVSLAAAGMFMALKPLAGSHPVAGLIDAAIYVSLVVAAASAPLAFSSLRLPAWLHVAAVAAASALATAARLAGWAPTYRAAGALLVSITAGYASAMFLIEYVRLLRGRGDVVRASLGFAYLAILLASIAVYPAITGHRVNATSMSLGSSAVICGKELFLKDVSVGVSGKRVTVNPGFFEQLWSMLEEEASAAKSQLASLASSYNTSPDRAVANILLSPEYRVSVLSPGMIGYIRAETVAGNASAEAVLEQPEPLLAWGESKLYVKVEPAGGDGFLRATILIRDLTLPQGALELLGSQEALMEASLHHVYFIANFTQPMILRSGRGWTLEVYSALIGSSILVGGKGTAETLLIGVRYSEAVVGVIEGAITVNATRIPIPAQLGPWALELQQAAENLRRATPALAQMVALEPRLMDALLGGWYQPPLEVDAPLYAWLNITLDDETLQLRVSAVMPGADDTYTVKVEEGLGNCYIDVSPPLVEGPLGTNFSLLTAYYLSTMIGEDRWKGLAALSLIAEMEGLDNLTEIADLYWLANNVAASPEAVSLGYRYNPTANLAWLSPWLMAAATGIVYVSSLRRKA